MWQIVNEKVKRMWFLRKVQKSAKRRAKGLALVRLVREPPEDGGRESPSSRGHGLADDAAGDLQMGPRSALRRWQVPCASFGLDEVEHDVAKARQKKVKVGSFQISPDGDTGEEKGIGKKLRASV